MARSSSLNPSSAQWTRDAPPLARGGLFASDLSASLPRYEWVRVISALQLTRWVVSVVGLERSAFFVENVADDTMQSGPIDASCGATAGPVWRLSGIQAES